MYKLVFFVPEQYKEQVKQAAFDAGAGHYQNYDCCSWETEGTGQFKPLSASQPFVGEQNKLETVSEYRVEMVCEDQVIKAVLQAMLAAHPYEAPAYDVCKIKDINDF